MITAPVQAEESLAQFSQASDMAPEPWRVVRLDQQIKATTYRISRWDGVLGIEAHADNSMALLARPVRVDLDQTPVLCWRWRVDAPLKTADLSKKSGDDFAARVYVSFALPSEALGFATRIKLSLARLIWGDAVPDAAINYVWDNHYAVGATQANAYTDRSSMIVSQSGAQNAGRWVASRHNVLADVRAAFAVENPELIQLAVASDTDNTGESAHAGFADFHFVAPSQACAFPLPREKP